MRRIHRASGLAISLLLLTSALLGCWSNHHSIAAELPSTVLQTADTAAIYVNVTDETGRRMPGAVVSVAGNTSTWETNESGTAFIDELTADPGGTGYALWASKEGYLDSATEPITVYPLTTYEMILVIQGAEMLCYVMTAVSPLSGAFVIVEDLGYSNVTGGDGSCTIAGIPSGTYNVTANATGYENRTISVTVVAGFEPPPQIFVLWPLTGTIFGVVSSAEGPLSGALVSISGTTYTNMTMEDGSYSILNAPVGTYVLNARATGYKLNEKTVTVTIGNSTRQDFLLEPLYEAAISGFVFHEGTDEPLEDASVSTRVGDVTFTVYSEKNGSYRIPNLPAGTYSVTASLSGFNSSRIDGVVVTTGNETSGVDFYLQEKPTRLYGVIKAGTVLLPNVRVTVVEANVTATSNIQGEYEIRNLPTGTYNVTATLEGYITSTTSSVVVPRGGETQLNINLTGLPGSLSGTVLAGDTREPLAGATIRIFGEQAVDRTIITNIQGQFEFKGLPDGSYTVRFEKDGYSPLEISPVEISVDTPVNLTEVLLQPLREPFGGFIFGFDLAHSMMILALFMTIVILALAVYLRIRSFQTPESAPAVYDEVEEEEEQEGLEEEAPLEKDSGV